MELLSKLEPFLLEAIVVVITIVWGIVKVKIASKNKWANRVTEIIEAAVIDTYLDFVRDLKAKSEEGKLTAEEKTEALQQTVARVKLLCKDAGIDLAKKVIDEVIIAKIEKVISSYK